MPFLFLIKSHPERITPITEYQFLTNQLCALQNIGEFIQQTFLHGSYAIYHKRIKTDACYSQEQIPVGPGGIKGINISFQCTVHPANRFIPQRHLFRYQIYRSCREHTDVRTIIQPQHIFHKGADGSVTSGNNDPVILFFCSFFGNFRHLFKKLYIHQINLCSQLLF